MRMKKLFFVAVTVAIAACSGETAKDATSAVVGKAIEVGKGTATGIATGVEEGRKHADSADGAVVVSNAEELWQHGGASVGEVTPNGEHATVGVLFDNSGEKPMRVTKIDVIVLDNNGVMVPTSGGAGELTVPAKAKARYTFSAAAKPEQVKTVRVYGKDLTK
jgi:hypothetical protein